MKKYFDLLKNYSIVFLALNLVKEIKRKVWREGVVGSYAQDYEDLKIELLFPKNFRGKYLEIGAYHPTRLSNTYRFYKKGWRGVVVEPNPEIKKLFKKIRPEDKYLEMGISDKKQKLKYFQFLIPALNTFSKKDAKECGHKIWKTSLVETKPIKEIIKTKIDFLSIDTEGFDEKILRSWPWKKYQPKVICVEMENENPKFSALLEHNGYKKCFGNRVNSIYARK